MGCFPPFNRSESWNKAGFNLSGHSCHICGSRKKVRRGKVYQTTCGGHEEVEADSPLYWEICEVCHEKGWQVPEEASMGVIFYSNWKTQEIKSLSIH